MSALLVRWRKVAVVGVLTAGLAFGTTLAAQPAQAAPARNLLGNGSAETVAKAMPKGWTKGGAGANTRVLTVAAGGAQSGKKFARTRITKYSGGAAWWYTPTAAVKAGTTYTFSEYYRSGSPTRVNAYFTVGRKTVGVQLGALRPAGRWTAAKYVVTVPAGATKVRFGHVLQAAGYVDVDNLSLTLGGKPAAPATKPAAKPPVAAASGKGLVSLTFDDGWTNQNTNALPILTSAGMVGTFYLISGYLGAGEYMTVAQAKQLQDAGSEIGSHTVSHKNLTTLDAAALDTELAQSKRTLEANFGPVTSLAYPYGVSNAQVQAAAAKYYSSARATNPGLNVKGTYNAQALTIGYVLNTTPLSTVQGWINQAKADNSWLILCYHQVANGNAADPYVVTPAAFSSQVAAVKNSGVKVVTVRQGLELTR